MYPSAASRYTAPDLQRWQRGFRATAAFFTVDTAVQAMTTLARKWPEWAPSPEHIASWAERCPARSYILADRIHEPGTESVAVDVAILRVMAALFVHYGPTVAAYDTWIISSDVGVDDRWDTQDIQQRVRVLEEFAAADILPTSA